MTERDKPGALAHLIHPRSLLLLGRTIEHNYGRPRGVQPHLVVSLSRQLHIHSCGLTSGRHGCGSLWRPLQAASRLRVRGSLCSAVEPLDHVSGTEASVPTPKPHSKPIVRRLLHPGMLRTVELRGPSLERTLCFLPRGLAGFSGLSGLPQGAGEGWRGPWCGREEVALNAAYLGLMPRMFLPLRVQM